MTLQPWQMDMLDKMSKYKGRGLIQATGRGTGKSMMTELMLNRPYWAAGELVAVDGEPWRTVICLNGVDEWIREQDPSLWVGVGNPNSFGSVFDIAEPLYLLLMLRWPK
jgi:hypothetical protein